MELYYLFEMTRLTNLTGELPTYAKTPPKTITL
jgi:hypothetical protein